MNSKQRRQARREFPYVVIIQSRNGEPYFHHDHRVEGGRNWCRKQLKKDTWRFREAWAHAEFKFVNEKDAAFFALKWT